MTLQHTATGALARVGGQEDLDLRVREHDGSDVATLGHDIAVLGGAALVDEHGGAHARVGRDLGHVGVDLRGANGSRSVLAVDGQARILTGAVGKANLDLPGEGVDGRLVIQIDAAIERGEGDGAIHGAVSSLLKPSWRAISLAMVDLPEPAGPSMATIMQCFLSMVGVLVWFAGVGVRRVA